MSAPTHLEGAVVFNPSNRERAGAWEQMQLVAVAEGEENLFETCSVRRRVCRNGRGLWFRHVG